MQLGIMHYIVSKIPYAFIIPSMFFSVHGVSKYHEGGNSLNGQNILLCF